MCLFSRSLMGILNKIAPNMCDDFTSSVDKSLVLAYDLSLYMIAADGMHINLRPNHCSMLHCPCGCSKVKLLQNEELPIGHLLIGYFLMRNLIRTCTTF